MLTSVVGKRQKTKSEGQNKGHKVQEELRNLRFSGNVWTLQTAVIDFRSAASAHWELSQDGGLAEASFQRFVGAGRQDPSSWMAQDAHRQPGVVGYY